MSEYTPTTGTVIQTGWADIRPQQLGCQLSITFQSLDQGLITLIVDGSTYVLNNRLINPGEQMTFFYTLSGTREPMSFQDRAGLRPMMYPANAPTPMIYPPQYRAVAAVHTPSGVFAALDVFLQNPVNSQLSNSDDTLRLNLSERTRLILPNGQPFSGSLSGKLLLVLYSATTRSIPAQTTPQQIVVFCNP